MVLSRLLWSGVASARRALARPLGGLKARRSTRSHGVFCLILLLAAGCSSVNVERHAFRLAETNRAHINKVRLGQTLVEVERIMGPPERRAARLRYDGVSVEEWSYVTDYVRKMDGLIVFVGGKVAEIQSVSWEERDREQSGAESS